MLLPSRPDTVQKSPPRKTQPSLLLVNRPDPTSHTLGQEFNPAIAGCGFRAPLPPHLARPYLISNLKPNKSMAEREGFEPPRQVLCPSTRSPGERLRPTRPSLHVVCYCLQPSNPSFIIHSIMVKCKYLARLSNLPQCSINLYFYPLCNKLLAEKPPVLR